MRFWKMYIFLWFLVDPFVEAATATTKGSYQKPKENVHFPKSHIELIEIYQINDLEKFLNCLKLPDPKIQVDWSILKCA